MKDSSLFTAEDYAVLQTVIGVLQTATDGSAPPPALKDKLSALSESASECLVACLASQIPSAIEADSDLATAVIVSTVYSLLGPDARTAFLGCALKVAKDLAREWPAEARPS